MMLQTFQNLSIRAKLGAIIAGLSLLLVLLIGGFLIVNEYSKLRRDLGSDLNVMSHIMGVNSAIGLVFGDPEASREVLSSLRVKTNIIAAHICDKQGRVFASYQRDAAASSPLRFEQVGSLTRFDQADGALVVPEHFVLSSETAEIYHPLEYDGRVVGGIFLLSDLEQFKRRMHLYTLTISAVTVASLLLVLLVASRLQRLITTPVYCLLNTVTEIARGKNYSLRASKHSNDEIGRLIDGVNAMLDIIEQRDRSIHSLNQRLSQENRRMGAELEVTRRLQQLILPTEQELRAVQGLDIAGFMQPADEVGGDYYDVLQHDGRIKISIGDVTGHGLESGMVMLMAQMAVRTLFCSRIEDPKQFMSILNEVLYANIERMQCDKNMTLALLDYAGGNLRIIGQHEEVLVVRKGGRVERFDTLHLGFMLGLLPDVSEHLAYVELNLDPGDGIVLYTDGITEARNQREQFYDLERLCQVVSRNWHLSAQAVKEAVVTDVVAYLEGRPLLDDITLLVVKRLV